MCSNVLLEGEAANSRLLSHYAVNMSLSKYDTESASTIRNTTKPCPQCGYVISMNFHIFVASVFNRQTLTDFFYQRMRQNLNSSTSHSCFPGLLLRRVGVACTWNAPWHVASFPGAGSVELSGHLTVRITTGSAESYVMC